MGRAFRAFANMEKRGQVHSAHSCEAAAPLTQAAGPLQAERAQGQRRGGAAEVGRPCGELPAQLPRQLSAGAGVAGRKGGAVRLVSTGWHVTAAAVVLQDLARPSSRRTFKKPEEPRPAAIMRLLSWQTTVLQSCRRLLPRAHPCRPEGSRVRLRPRGERGSWKSDQPAGAAIPAVL